MKKVKLNTITWVCGDCGNVYSVDIRFCPNILLDGLITSSKSSVTREDLRGV